MWGSGDQTNCFLGATPKWWFHKGKCSPNCHPAWWTMGIDIWWVEQCISVSQVGKLILYSLLVIWVYQTTCSVSTRYWICQSTKMSTYFSTCTTQRNMTCKYISDVTLQLTVDYFSLPTTCFKETIWHANLDPPLTPPNVCRVPQTSYFCHSPLLDLNNF